MIRLLICDDSAEARSALRTMLGGQAEIEIVGEATDGSEAIALAIELSPDVILMDVAMPGLDGVEATRRLRELLPSARIVAFAGSDDAEDAQAMIEAGASAYCVKGAPLHELERAIAGANPPLVRLAHGLARALAGGGVGQLVARELAELSGAALAATYLTTADVGLSSAGQAGPAASDAFVAAPGLVLRAFDEAEAAWATGHELAELYRLGVPSGQALAVPLVGDGQALGALLVAMPANVQLELDADLVTAVADLAAASLANERRLALTFAEARRDALTGLPNRRAFDEHLDEALRRGDGVALALLDLDDFKQINDREGHAAGDRTLRELTRVALRSLRTEEELFRIGGDEFALVVAGPAPAAGRAAERIRAAAHRQSRGHRLPTLSAGVAGVPDDAATKDDLLRLADTALYAAKRAGKDRAVVYSAELVLRAADPPRPAPAEPKLANRPTPAARRERHGLRVLVVDDDPSLRVLLRATFEIIDIEVEEAASAEAAAEWIAVRPPDVLVLDIAMPGLDGISFCRRLKEDATTKHIPVVLLTGLGEEADGGVEAARADALVRKPFSPLELLATIERLAGGLYEGPFRLMTEERPEEQLLLYAQDLRRLLEVERGQRTLLQNAYEETVTALVSALESKDTGTHAHSRRVQRYARALTSALDRRLLEDPSLDYGFLLHDVGKIGIPDRILQKPGPLTRGERRLMQMHTVLGEQMLAKVALLGGEGLKVIRSHHERWDGRGYPDRLAGPKIPPGGRIFAVADALDAITSDRPYRQARSWDDAVAEIVGQARRQFDPGVVEAFRVREPELRTIYEQLTPSIGLSA